MLHAMSSMWSRRRSVSATYSHIHVRLCGTPSKTNCCETGNECGAERRDEFTTVERLALATIRNILFRETDPIRREYVRKRFWLSRNGVSILFDADVLFEYIKESGDLRDPVARERYQTHEMMRLQRICGRRLENESHLCDMRRKELERQNVLFYLVDEVIRNSRRDRIAVDALENIHSIATPSEQQSLSTFFQRNGVDVSFVH